ncbi:MAG: pyridoxal phosphate-dependent decarboxylase family protein [Gemmatimonadaceae bacterium]
MTSHPAPSPLSLPAESMRALGYRVVDHLVDRLTHLESQPVPATGTRQALEDALREPVPEVGTAPDRVLDRVLRDVLPHVAATDHPRFFAFVPSPGNFISVLADALAAGHNVFAGHWLVGAGAAEVELVAIDWLRTLCGLPPSTAGLFVSGGSVATLTALAAARHAVLGRHRDDAVVYASDQTHASLAKDLRVLGFAPAQLRTLRSDDAFRLSVPALQAAVAEDRATGRRPFCVVANAGTTSTGAVDPLEAVAALCHAEGLWLHVDGAYGAAAVLTETGRAALRGLELADSLTLDPHKWWFQPYEIGCVLVRDGQHLRSAFSVHDAARPAGPSDRRHGAGAPADADAAREAAYLADTVRADATWEVGEVNFYDYGVQLTRSFRALKLWMSLQVFGLSAFRTAVARGIALAEHAERQLRAAPHWEVVTPAQLGVVTFRYGPPGASPAAIDACTRDVVAAMLADGYAMVTSTALRGRPVLRLCPIHPAASEADVDETLHRVAQFGRMAHAARHPTP